MTPSPCGKPPTVSEAQELILSTVPVLEVEECPLERALGTVLAEGVAADRDLPPFDCSAMDGYAVRADDLRQVPVVLPVLEKITAGKPPTRPVEPGTCSAIMTGAVVPEGADAVVMVEHTEPVGETHVRFLKPVGKRNIRYRGEEARAGEVVLPEGGLVRPPEVGLLAMVGRTSVKVVRKPRVAILTTGDELVGATRTPAPGQIRDSNGPVLSALCRQAGFEVEVLGIARDRLDDLQDRIRAGLERCDVLLVSAGVSVGEFDLVPRALAAAGAEKRLHGIRVKPGKPVALYTAANKVIFGVPGKPVSTVVSFLLFVLPALRRMAGWRECLPETVPALLRKPFRKKVQRQQYEPAWLERAEDHYEVEALPTHGSGDLVALCRANALLVCPPGVEVMGEGETVEVVRLPQW